MRTLYLDAFSGIAGDMLVAALLDAGADRAAVDGALAALPLEGYAVLVEPVQVNGIAALRFTVRTDAKGRHPHRTYGCIRELLERSALQPPVRELALRVFARLADAEARIHGTSPDAVTFHEVGALDSIVDIVAGAAALVSLEVDSVFVSPLPAGRGTVSGAHGTLPVPAPATLELLRGFVLRPADGEGEMVTPTGAAFLAVLARSGDAPPLRPERIGYGAGTRQLPDRPNLLRAVVGQACAPAGLGREMVLVECNLDDLSPEITAHAAGELLAAGARDVWLVPVQMKKGRPGILLQCLAEPTDRERLGRLLLRETSTLGYRWRTVHRVEVPRERVRVETEYGPVPVKVGRAPDGSIHLAPEIEVCRERARSAGVPLKRVYQAAVAAAHQRLAGGGGGSP